MKEPEVTKRIKQTVHPTIIVNDVREKLGDCRDGWKVMDMSHGSVVRQAWTAQRSNHALFFRLTHHTHITTCKVGILGHTDRTDRTRTRPRSRSTIVSGVNFRLAALEARGDDMWRSSEWLPIFSYKCYVPVATSQ